MTQERHPTTTEPLLDLAKTTRMAQCLLLILAAPHRLIHNRIGSAGARAIDRFTWIGAFFVLPAFTARWPPLTLDQRRNVYHAWQGLLALAFLHAAASFWSRRPRHSQEVGQPRCGRLEIPVALAVAYLAAIYCGTGAGAFLVTTLVANQLLLLSIAARYRRMAALRHDGELEAANFRFYNH